MPHIVLLGTCDTKLNELLFLRSQILDLGDGNTSITVVDVGRSPIFHEAITIPQSHLTTNYAPASTQEPSNLPRGEAIKYMITCASAWLQQAYEHGLKDSTQAIHGIISTGGTGGTSLASAVMRNVLPIGFPKLIVSTAASGDTGPIIEEDDISLIPSVVDVAGLNSILRRILSNAAGSIVGMAKAYERSFRTEAQPESQKKKIGITMFGVTTPCCDIARRYLESNYDVECFVFHCTGHGGKALERLVEQGELDAVLDITTTEICDHLAGGVMSAGEHRLEAALKKGIPYIVSMGATDMVNFGPKSTVPERYQQRKLFEHNPTVTLMRTSPDDCKAIGEYIVEKLKKFATKKDSVQVILPKGGVSIIAIPDEPFYDPDADHAIFSTITRGLETSGIEVVEDDRAINDEQFALDIAKRLATLMNLPHNTHQSNTTKAEH